MILAVLIALAILAVGSKLTEGWWAGLLERRAKPSTHHLTSPGSAFFARIKSNQ